MEHFLKQFEGQIQDQALLRASWNVLLKAAHEAIDAQLAAVAANDKRIEKGNRFESLRAEFEEICRKNNIETPELNLKAFTDLILRY